MILAAGRGNRLRPLTDVTPKPLIKVLGKPLIVYHLENLHQAGICNIVINVKYLGEQIQDYLGTGSKWGVKIRYSVESTDLEVGGGILNALSLLGDSPFLIVNGDIWTNYPFSSLKRHIDRLAHLVLVDNPLHNLTGDYSIEQNGLLSRNGQGQCFTYSGISILHPDLFKGQAPGSCFRLATLLDKAASIQSLYGEYFKGAWTDVGTIERLQHLESSLMNQSPEQKMFN